MAHAINALIADRRTLSGLASRFGPPDPIELPLGLVMVPLNVQRLDTLAVSAEAPFEGFLFLKPAIANEIERGLGAGRALYIETEYFGGRGEQSAALFEDGRLVWRGAESNAEPVFQKTWHQPYFDLATRTQRKSSISQGLSMLGVVPSADGDEFDRLGLGHFRSLHALFG